VDAMFYQNYSGARGDRTPYTRSYISNGSLHDHACHISPGIGNMSPNRPRSAVPATRQIEMIVLPMIDPSNFIIPLNVNETEDMIRTERAHALSIKLPTHRH